ncbi:DNA-binding transcriptional regulator, MarR family [Solimonas aquatica]|uniref:DNA-binding transcriptional regulator, MarR family n=1 Tax=Solimonas aquatica TaxID=489703 RepID=A0A1H9FJQ5_9GAMM|nr:MarR family winged helix-turn-helix transcriptional regulator [Solimonas aquatica]SEQ38139.1 DNA-binding transcriptional regulator, MarR family [Solimonas aquatica]
MKAKRYHLPYLEDVRNRRHVCFSEQLRSANRSITKLYNEYLGGTDIGIAQFSLLIRLYYFGEVKMSRLARALETERTTVARNVQLLERSGHLEVVAGEDARHRLVRLTPKGFASLEKALPHWRRAQDDLLKHLGPAQWDALFKGLRVLAELERLQDGGPGAAAPQASSGRKKKASG